ncbi:uncharacterized protein SCHCODRAFT_02505405, partial [Schizophyllum commune H4-8]|uniref:uncharacterized protein n=1 Tax=Schizophyllum commune (strain H4-8 / FGSC 9210) TaxID=578458 RepID=UPI00215DEEFC
RYFLPAPSRRRHARDLSAKNATRGGPLPSNPTRKYRHPCRPTRRISGEYSPALSPYEQRGSLRVEYAAEPHFQAIFVRPQTAGGTRGLSR